MSAEKILKSLPADTQWLVLFRLPRIQEITDDETIRAMFFLPQDTKVSDYSFVTLSSKGTLLLEKESSRLINIHTGKEQARQKTSKDVPEEEGTVYDKYIDSYKSIEADDPDCVGLGSRPPMPPVLVGMTIEKGLAKARAVLYKKPDFSGYELLKAIGVTYLGGEEENGKFIARYENKLPSHIHSGILAHFTRTDNCNQFYFNHCNIDELIGKGLEKAVTNKIKYGKEKTFNKVKKLAEELPDKIHSLVCVPPKPAPEFDYGDIVPYGFLLTALGPFYNPDFMNTLFFNQKIVQYLNDNSRDGLWAYGRGGLPTATDSSLVLMGYYKQESVEKLEMFSDGKGGYIPQLCASEEKAGYMLKDASNAHWCNTDTATTYLIKALRDTVGLPAKTPDDFFKDTFDRRGGLYFANPYMTDYFLAMALRELSNPELKTELRKKLKNEILASMNEDYTFGKFDIPLSTAFAILALSELDFDKRVLSLSQLKLLDYVTPDGMLPSAIPFYSTLKLDPEKFSPAKITEFLMLDEGKQIIEKNGDYYSISLYEDRTGIISAPVLSMAFSVKSDPGIDDTDLLKRRGEVRKIYRCENHKEYIELILANYL